VYDAARFRKKKYIYIIDTGFSSELGCIRKMRRRKEESIWNFFGVIYAHFLTPVRLSLDEDNWLLAVRHYPLWSDQWLKLFQTAGQEHCAEDDRWSDAIPFCKTFPLQIAFVPYQNLSQIICQLKTVYTHIPVVLWQINMICNNLWCGILCNRAMKINGRHSGPVMRFTCLVLKQEESYFSSSIQHCAPWKQNTFRT